MPRYMVDCYETAIRFKTIAVEADSVEEARELALTKVDFDGAEWNSMDMETEDVWREDDE